MDFISSDNRRNRPFVSSLDLTEPGPFTPETLSIVCTPIPRSQSHDSGIDVRDHDDDDDDDETMSIPLEIRLPTMHWGRKYHSYPDAVEMYETHQQASRSP